MRHLEAEVSYLLIIERVPQLLGQPLGLRFLQDEQ
jgi:hypothetical protein